MPLAKKITSPLCSHHCRRIARKPRARRDHHARGAQLPNRVTLRVRLLSWLPVVLWALLIYGSSTSSFASPQTSRILVPVLHWLLPGLAPQTLDLIHEFARKCVHFVNYFILGLLLFRALREPNKGWALRWALLAVLLAFTYAASDEYHQSFEAGRGASAMDALLDTAGAATAQALTWALLRRWQRPAPAERVRG